MILVKQYFRGRETQEQVIAPGQYSDKDKRLFGLADYLIEMGVAERVDIDTQDDPPKGPPKRPGKFVGVSDDEEPADSPQEDTASDDTSQDEEKPGDDFLDETNRPRVKRNPD